MTARELQLLTYLQQFLTDGRKERFEEVLSQRTNHFGIALENIYQPHNANAAIRTCDCFGIQKTHIIEGINKFTTSKGVSKGAIKWVSMLKYESSKEAVSELRNQGYQIVATSPHNKSVSLAEFDVSKPSIFFFGAEKKGLSDYILEEADCRVHIPMVGHTESLNISVAAAIVLQHVTQKLKQRDDIEWGLSEEEKNEIRLAWTKESMHRLPNLLEYFEENH